MRQAAYFWALARNAGRATSDPMALDGDVILAGQAITMGFAPHEILVATSNVDHLSRFVAASEWEQIG
jgi:hypothetical protein